MRELDGCVAVLGARGEMSGVTEDYRQDGNFLWLTGINEGDAWILLAPKAKHDRSVLFLRPRDPEHERWTGPREPLSPALLERFGVDRVLRGRPDRTAIASALGTDCVAVIAPVDDVKDERPDAVLSRQVAGALGLKVVYKRDLLSRLREVHEPQELTLMEKAIDITRLGHEAAARATVAGVVERDVQTKIEYAFFSNGATGLSYASIVGSGPNGAVLHWDHNDRPLRAGTSS
jgi:Xaa-Pro aminopeptidase